MEKQFSSPSAIKKAFGINAKRVSLRLTQMKDSPNLLVLQQIPAANCHPLSQDRQGQWAVDISGNYRLIFEIDHDPTPRGDDGSVNAILVTDIQIIETTDYH